MSHTVSAYREQLLAALREAGRPLSFRELAEEVARRAGGRVNLYLLRVALSELVRSGEVVRLPDHERRVMVFALPRGKD